jgi:hypothetical protein
VWVQEMGEGVLWSMAVSPYTCAITRADIAGTCQTNKESFMDLQTIYPYEYNLSS